MEIRETTWTLHPFCGCVLVGLWAKSDDDTKPDTFVGAVDRPDRFFRGELIKGTTRCAHHAHLVDVHAHYQAVADECLAKSRAVTMAAETLGLVDTDIAWRHDAARQLILEIPNASPADLARVRAAVGRNIAVNRKP